MNTDNQHDALDFRLDELLAEASLRPSDDFADKIMLVVNTGDACDTLLDERLSVQLVVARPERTERLYAGAIASIRRRKWFAWSGSMAAALIAGVLAVPVFLNHESSELNPDVLVMQAMERDPALADMLRNEGTVGNAQDQDTVAAVLSGLNDNTLNWLEALTSNES